MLKNNVYDLLLIDTREKCLKRSLLVILTLVLLILVIMQFSNHCFKARPDNPDLRVYMNIAASGATYSDLKQQLPDNLIKKELSFDEEQPIPDYPGKVYYRNGITNRGFVSYLRIQQKGKYWSYAGNFYFNQDGICIAVSYESWTSNPDSRAVLRYWQPPDGSSFSGVSPGY